MRRSSTYVDKSQMGPNQGGGGGAKKPSYGIWTAFLSFVTQVEEAKRYSRDGTWVKPVVVPSVLKNTEPGKFGAHGFDRVAYNWRIGEGDVHEPITFSTEPWTDLM